jgi:polysaccharide pyruvyl transferase WcaK-like protein
MRLVAPFGFYGWGNIGDESTLQGFARLLAHYGNGTRAWVASRNPSHTARIEPSLKYYNAAGNDLRGTWARFRANAAVVAGGTPIMDVFGAWPLKEVATAVAGAVDRHQPFAFVGSGTETLKRQDSRRLVSELLAPRVCHWTVRSMCDKERLSEYGVPGGRITVAADMAWMLDSVTKDFGERYLAGLGIDPSTPCVGVNLTGEQFALAQQPELFSRIAAFLDAITENSARRVLFLANEVRDEDTFDAAASRKVIASMKNADRTLIVPNRYWSPQEMMSLIACCHVTLSMRYHFCLFSAVQGIPFIALQRSDKVADLCRDLSWPHGVSLDDLSAPRLVSIYADLEYRRPQHVATLAERVVKMRDRALQNRIALDRLRDEQR